MDKDIYIELLKKEVVPALGCTEPIAIAYVTSKCKELLKDEIESINAAIQCDTLALNDIEPKESEGIVGIDVERSIENLGTLGVEGMENTDKTILNMMLNK